MSNYPYKTELRICGDCGALPGYAHSIGCDVARCPECGEQQLQCEEHDSSTLPSIWTGIWPGTIECVEYDLWTKWVSRKTGEVIDFAVFGEPGTWKTTTADDPNGRPDLNTLHTLPLRWDVQLQRFFKDERFGNG